MVDRRLLRAEPGLAAPFTSLATTRWSNPSSGRASRELQAKRRRRLVAAVAAAAVVAGTVSLWQGYQSQLSGVDEQPRLALATLSQQPQRGLIQAIHATARSLRWFGLVRPKAADALFQATHQALSIRIDLSGHGKGAISITPPGGRIVAVVDHQRVRLLEPKRQGC